MSKRTLSVRCTNPNEMERHAYVVHLEDGQDEPTTCEADGCGHALKVIDVTGKEQDYPGRWLATVAERLCVQFESGKKDDDPKDTDAVFEGLTLPQIISVAKTADIVAAMCKSYAVQHMLKAPNVDVIFNE